MQILKKFALATMGLVAFSATAYAATINQTAGTLTISGSVADRKEFQISSNATATALNLGVTTAQTIGTFDSLYCNSVGGFTFSVSSTNYASVGNKWALKNQTTASATPLEYTLTINPGSGDVVSTNGAASMTILSKTAAQQATAITNLTPATSVKVTFVNAAQLAAAASGAYADTLTFSIVSP